MPLKDSRQLRLVADVAHPRRQLGVPAERVAPDRLVVLYRPVHEVVRPGEVEGVVARLRGVPLHRVLGGHLSKVLLDDRGGHAGREAVLVGARAKVELALGLHEGVEARWGLALLDQRGCQDGQGREKKQSNLHRERSNIQPG